MEAFQQSYTLLQDLTPLCNLSVGKPLIPSVTFGDASAWYRRLLAGDPAVIALFPEREKSVNPVTVRSMVVSTFVNSVLSAALVGLRISSCWPVTLSNTSRQPKGASRSHRVFTSSIKVLLESFHSEFRLPASFQYRSSRLPAHEARRTEHPPSPRYVG